MLPDQHICILLSKNYAHLKNMNLFSIYESFSDDICSNEYIFIHNFWFIIVRQLILSCSWGNCFNHCFIAWYFLGQILTAYVSLDVLSMVSASKWDMKTNGSFVCSWFSNSSRQLFKAGFQNFPMLKCSIRNKINVAVI